MAAVGTLGDEALKRKERLNTLKSKQAFTSETDEPPNKKANVEKLPRPVFRSYNPRDDTLKESKLSRNKPVEVTEQVKEHLEAAKPQPLVEEVDLVNLAPRKPDWDLKRDISKKLEKLERQTQRAIAELIRERIQAGQVDLAAAVDANAAVNSDDEDD